MRPQQESTMQWIISFCPSGVNMPHSPPCSVPWEADLCGLDQWLPCPLASGWVQLMLATSKRLDCKKRGKAGICLHLHFYPKLCLILLLPGGNKLAIPFLGSSSSLHAGCPLPVAAPVSGSWQRLSFLVALGSRDSNWFQLLLAPGSSLSPICSLNPAHTFENIPFSKLSSITYLNVPSAACPDTNR